MLSPRAVTAALVRIGAGTPDAVSSPTGGRGGVGGLHRRSGSSEQCRPEPTTEAALAQRPADAGSPTAAPAAAAQVSSAGLAAPAASALLWAPYGRLPMLSGHQRGAYEGGTPTQQRGLAAAAAAVQGLDTSTILQQAAALTASGAGNRLFDLVAPGLLAMQQHHQQHGLPAGPYHAAAAQDPHSSAYPDVTQALQAALRPAGPRMAAPLLHGVNGSAGGGATAALLRLQQQLAAGQQQSGHVDRLLGPRIAEPDHQHPRAMASRSYNVQQGSMSTVRFGLQSTSLPIFAGAAPADRSSRRVVSGNEAAPPAQGASDRQAGFGGGQTVTVEDMQQVAAALVERHREAMAQQAPRCELPILGDRAQQCAPPRDCTFADDMGACTAVPIDTRLGSLRGAALQGVARPAGSKFMACIGADEGR